MSEFPRAELLAYANSGAGLPGRVAVQAVEAYEALSDRFVLKCAEDSITIANLRALAGETDGKETEDKK